MMRSFYAMLLLIAVAVGPAWGAPKGAVTEGNHRAPRLGDLPLKRSVTQYGITWTFNKPVRVGQFVNGDYYVVGEAVVKAIDPKPRIGDEVPASELDEEEGVRGRRSQAVRNGSMLNPRMEPESGFDSGIRNHFRYERLTVPPITMKPGDALASSISLKQGEKVKWEGNEWERKGGRSPIRVAAVLTCVAAPLPPDAFRPAFADRTQKIYLARNLRRGLLPRLPPVPAATSPDKYREFFRKPWLNFGSFGFDVPLESVLGYGAQVGNMVGAAGLILCLDFKPEEKEGLLVNMVQVGIDLYGMVRSGFAGWPAWGGHSSGRKFPIVFAGVMLGDDEMAYVSRTLPRASFGEDEQTAFGECWSGAKVVFAGHSGISSVDGKSRDGVRQGGKLWGPYEHLPPSRWNKDQCQSEAYRRCCTSFEWAGQALAMRLMKAEKYWYHDAFFAYLDRWMTEDDTLQRAEIDKYCPDLNLSKPSSAWAWQGSIRNPFVREMWVKYRPTVEPPPSAVRSGQALQKKENGSQGRTTRTDYGR